MTLSDVRISRPAVRQLHDAYGAIPDRAAAGIWRDGMRAAVLGLALIPERCPLAPEVAGLDLPVHVLIFGRSFRCRVLYLIEDSGVTVLAIRPAPARAG